MKTHNFVFRCPHCGCPHVHAYRYALVRDSLDRVVKYGNEYSAEYVETDYVDGADDILPEDINSPYYANFMCYDCNEGRWSSVEAMIKAGALVLEQED